MKIIDIIQSSPKPFFSLEVVPPETGLDKEELLERIAPLMELKPKFLNVTRHRDDFTFRQEKDGSFTKHLARRSVSQTAVCATVMARYPEVEVVPHILCGGATADEIEYQLYDLIFMGIENIMALRGDTISGEKRFTPTPGGFSHANELVQAIRSFGEGVRHFCIGVAGYPEKHFEAPNLEQDILRLKAKVDAGADYVTTQMFFDNSRYYTFVEKCRAAGITVPIIPGLKPLSTRRHLELLPRTFSIDLPEGLAREVDQAGDDAEAIYEIGTQWCIAQAKDLLANGVPAIHFYTMGKSRNVVKILKECFFSTD
jgi:methylenetetrahydrofolate reductase (NADPH)